MLLFEISFQVRFLDFQSDFISCIRWIRVDRHGRAEASKGLWVQRSLWGVGKVRDRRSNIKIVSQCISPFWLHKWKTAIVTMVPIKIYQETLMARAVTMKVLANGSWKHLQGRWVHISTSNQIKLLGNKNWNLIFQGIEIAISELTGPSDCTTDYLEVWCHNHF